MTDTSKAVEKFYWHSLHQDVVAASDYDALATKLAEVEAEWEKEIALRATAEAKLAEVEEERGNNRVMVNIAYLAGYYQSECGLPEHPDAKEAAEAMLPRAYRAGVEANAKWLRKQAAEKGNTKTPQGRTALFYARKLTERPTPTTTDLLAQLKETE